MQNRLITSKGKKRKKGELYEESSRKKDMHSEDETCILCMAEKKSQIASSLLLSFLTVDQKKQLE